MAQAPSSPSPPSRSCRCGQPLDHHRAGCSEAGLLGKRGFLLEGQLNNVCREAGARVSTNVFVRDMDLTRPRWWQTASLCGRARRKAATHNGAALQCARRRKTTTYPELTGEGGRARLVVLAAEVGGRFSEVTASFVHALAKAESRGQPPMLQGRVRAALSRRWEGILACRAAKSFAVSLSDHRSACNTGMDPRCTRCCGMSGPREVSADVHSHLVVFCVEIWWMIFAGFPFKKKGLACLKYVTANSVVFFWGE